MAKGELVSSAVIVTLMRRVMRNHPGKRVLLDGFPRSLQNAHDLVELCGKPELALHLVCDDTIMMERILKRSGEANGATQRDDDNIHTALHRLRTYHKFHNSTMEWLREQHVPVVNLDSSGSEESVWEQLSAIGRLMRPAVKMGNSGILPFPTTAAAAKSNTKDDDDNSSAAA
jgi:adenylate kinase family enzyme